jgi:sucrose-6-phosphate hydrolase SacC (GH32 family)
MQGAIGEFGGATEDQPTHISITVDNPFASVILASKDGTDLATSKAMFLTTVGKGENTGQAWTARRDTLTAIGRAPFLMEKVTGSVTLRGIADLDRIEVYNTNASGVLTTQITPSVQDASILIFPIGDSIWYAILRSEE